MLKAATKLTKSTFLYWIDAMLRYACMPASSLSTMFFYVHVLGSAQYSLPEIMAMTSMA